MAEYENKTFEKEDIGMLDISTLEDMFDVYNYKLAEDRGYNVSALSDDELDKVNADIKSDYIKYFKSLCSDSNFIIYTLRYKDSKPIAVCRVINREDGIYIEGLETHRDYRKCGHAKAILAECVSQLKQMKYSKVFSVIRKWNSASLNTHYSVGFKMYKEDGDNYILCMDFSHL